MRAQLDVRTDLSFGRRATDWELKGVPVRLELGPRDLANGEVTMARRISGDKAPVQLAGIVQTRARCARRRAGRAARRSDRASEARTADVGSLDEARAAAETGWARLPWDTVGTEGEAELATSGVTVRCLTRADGSLPASEDEPDLVALRRTRCRTRPLA